MFPNSEDKLNNLSQIKNIDFSKGIIEYKGRNNSTKKLNIKSFLEKASGNNNNNEKNKNCIFPLIENNFSPSKDIKDNIGSKKILNLNNLNNTINKKGKKIKLKLSTDNIKNNNNNNNNNDNNNIINDKNFVINIIQNKKKILLSQNEKNNSLIKFLDLLINLNEKEPEYFYNNNNIMNMVSNMNYIKIKGEELCFIGKKNSHYLTSKLKNNILLLEKKFLNALNTRLDIKLTGKELKLEINGKKIESLDLELLFALYSDQLEELDLSHNKIKNIEPIRYLYESNLQILNLSNNRIKDITPLKYSFIPKCKKLDLSFNNINNITPLGEAMKNNNGFEIINLNNNRIKNVESLKSNISKNIKEILLDNNKVLLKDIEEIKNIIMELNGGIYINKSIRTKDKEEKEKEKIFIIYKKNDDNDNVKIKLFNIKFIEKNKEKCKIIINGNENELIEEY